MKSELIPANKHLAKRQSVHFRRVFILISHEPLKRHGRTIYNRKQLVTMEKDDYYRQVHTFERQP